MPPNPALDGALNPAEPEFWLAACTLVALVAVHLAWLVHRRLARRPGAAALEASLRALGWLGTALFFLWPPIAAWEAGAVSPYAMGVAELDWAPSLTQGALPTVALGGVLLAAWLAYRHGLPRPQARAWPARAGGILRAAVDAALLQWHWAFYRALLIELAREIPKPAGGGLAPALSALAERVGAAPQYWGAWLALALVAAMWVANPFARSDLSRPGPAADAALRQAALALGTTALFLLTRNFWLCLGCHVVVEAAIAAWFPAPLPAQAQEETAAKTGPVSG